MANIPMKTLRLYGLDDTYTIPTAPEHIGAAPAGYGLGGEAKQVSSWDDAIQTGFYMSPTGPLNGPWFYGFVIRKTDKILIQKVWANDEQTSAFGCGFYSAERRKLGSTWGEWEWDNPPMKPSVEYRTTERIDGKVVYKKNVDGVIQYRLDGETTWHKYADAVGAAPSGYGLGTHLATVRKDVNSATTSGWHLIEPGATNSPDSTYYAVVRTDSVDGNSVVQTAWLLDAYFSKLVRRKMFGTWGAWGWVNPPMVLGKEYRTTERNGGSAVYVKRIAYKLGAIDASGASVDSIIPHGISDFAYLIRTHCVKDSYVLPYLKSDGGFTSIASVDATNITLRAYKAVWAEATWIIDLYYVKY